MEWTGMVGKKIFLRTKKGREYSGVVEEVTDTGDGLIFILIKDKFGMIVGFTTGEIAEFREERF